MPEVNEKYLVVITYKGSRPLWQVIKRDGTVLHQCATRKEAIEKCNSLKK